MFIKGLLKGCNGGVVPLVQLGKSFIIDTNFEVASLCLDNGIADSANDVVRTLLGSAMDAIARQPEATGKIQTNMILTSAFVEGCALFAIVACAFLIK